MKRLAVVPFHEMSGGRDGDAFADGFAEAVCGALARSPGLEVMPPTTTRHIAREGTASVARELNVDHVLSGTVHRAGERLRVTCSLVNGAQGTTVFAESFEGTREQLFTLEDQLVKALASALRLAPPSPQPDRHTPDPIAHEKLLQARGYLQRFDNEASVDGAIKLLEPMAHDGGASASVWAELGRAYRQKYHHDMRQVWIERSLHACEQALLADPRHARALACLGVVHELLGREEEAERELLRALDLEPELPAALSGLISLYTKQGRLDEAESLARRASALRPRDWVVPNLLGVARFQAGRYAEAITAWEQVRRLVPDNARAVYNIAAAHFEMGRLDEAERLYRESLEMQRSAIALSGLGTVLFYQGEYLGAESAFERAVGLKPMDAKLWGNLADARRWLPGRDEQARDDYRQAIGLAVEYLERNPTDLQMRGDLVSWLACSGDLESATSQLERVLSMDPANLHALRIAVTVHELSGRRDAALASLREALKAGSDSGPFERDRDLVALRETAEYKTLRVERHDAPRAAERPSPTPAPGE